MSKRPPAEQKPDREIEALRRRIGELEAAEALLRAEAARLAGELERVEGASHHASAIEAMLAAISTRFVNVPIEQLDNLIERCLEEAGKFLGVDRAYLFLFSEDGRSFSNTFEWCGAEISPEIDQLQNLPAERFPWIVAQLRRAETVVVARLTDLPAEAAAERAEFSREGLRSLLNVPIYHMGQTVGFVGFDAVRADRSWTGQEVRCLRILAELFAGALDRQRAEAARRESEERFRRAFEEGPVGMCLVGTDERYLQVNRAYADLLGLRPEELIGHSVADTICAEDLRGALPLLRRVLKGRLPRFTIEVRYVHKNDGLVWGRITGTAVRDREGHVMYGLNLVEDISQRKQAEEQAAREQHLLRRLLDLHERERKLFAYEIHDGLAQQLTAALFSFQALDQVREKDSAEARRLFQSGLQLLTEGIRETRRLISGLRPPILDESGVVAAIEYLVADLEKRTGMEIDFSHDVQSERLAAPLENAVFRIAQEALTNATRYSQTPKIEVRLEQSHGRLLLEVRDWGVGFRPEAVAEDHFGVRGIRERARLLGGRSEIQSLPGKGTRVRVELPLIEASADNDTDFAAFDHASP